MASEILKIDAVNSHVSFSLKKLGLLTVKGNISGFIGQITFNEEDLNHSSFDICVHAATITTNNQKRDEHLKSEDFFSVKKHPDICFKSSAIRKKNGQFRALGTLTILKTSRAVEIPFDFKEGVFEGQFSLNRLDYNLGSKFPAFVAGKTIQVSINCSVH